MRINSLHVGVVTLLLAQVSEAGTLMCKVGDAFQLEDGGSLKRADVLRSAYAEAFYVDSENGRVTGGPMDTEHWGETQVYPVQKYRSFTVVSYTHGEGTNRGLRTLYVGERQSNGRHAFQISDGLFIYSGTCK